MSISRSAQRLLDIMKEHGIRPLVRATTGRATYFTDAMGERDCTNDLLELHKAGFVEHARIDEGPGWVTYAPTRAGESDMSEQAARIWEEVQHGDGDLRSTWLSDSIEICRACRAEKPTHKEDCPIAALEQRVEGLKPYLIHGRDCHYDRGDEDWDAIPCNCGLIEALASQEEARSSVEP